MADKLDVSLDEVMTRIRENAVMRKALNPCRKGSIDKTGDLSLYKIDKITPAKPIETRGYYMESVGGYHSKAGTPVWHSIDQLTNHTDYEQTLTSSAGSITYSNTTTTQLTTGFDIGAKVSVTSKVFIEEISMEASLTLHVGVSTSTTETTSITRTIPSQNIRIPPRSYAKISAMMIMTQYIGKVEVSAGLTQFEEGWAKLSSPSRKVEYKINMAEHVFRQTPPFPYDTQIPPVLCKELRAGRNVPVEIYTEGEYVIEHGTQLQVRVDIYPIGGQNIMNSYSYEI